MDYPSPSRPEVQNNYDYHQAGDSRAVVQWTPQDNRDYQNAVINSRQGGDVNVYANNVYIENNGRPAQVYAPVQEVQPVQRVGYNCYPNNGCYDRRGGDEAAAAFFGAVIGGVIGGVISDRHHHRGHHDRGWDRGGWDRGGWDRRYPQYPRHNPFPTCPPYYGGNRGGYNYNRGRCR